MGRKSKIVQTLLEYVPISLLVIVFFVVLFFVLMKQLEKVQFSDKKKSLIITFYSFIALVLILFSIRFWPPSNIKEILIAQGGGGGGMEINFGDSDLGSGSDYQSEVLDVSDKESTAQEEVANEDILSQENINTEAPVVVKTESKNKPSDVVPKKVVPTETKVEPKKTNSALSNILKGKNKGGDGDDGVAGNKGKTNGSLSSSDYYGDGGSGGGSGGGHGSGNGTGTGSGIGPGSGGGTGGGVGYSLGNRKALIKPLPKYVCNESGRVVVEVQVDKNGNTISAVPGIKGTTNTAKCLLDQAKVAAMNTKWQSSESAPETQRGNIVYNFSISQ